MQVNNWKERVMEKYCAMKMRRRCPFCGGPADIPGRVLCSRCSGRGKFRNREWRAWHRARGICPACGGKTRGLQVYCDSCAGKRGSHEREYYRFRVENGICPRCGKPMEESGKSICPACLEARKERRGRWRNEGRCAKCGRPLDEAGHVRCSSCRSRAKLQKERARERKRDGGLRLAE